MESLSQCSEFAHSPIRLFVDGPASPAHVEAVNETRRIALEAKHPEIAVTVRPVNMGLRRAIFAGVTEVLAEADRVIVLEEDCLVSPVILRYFNDALNTYENDSRIYTVCAHVPFVASLQRHDTALLLPSAHPLGWATWRRAWDGFSVDSFEVPESMTAPAMISRVNASGLRNYRAMIDLAVSGLVDSWFVYWIWRMASHDALSVFPPRNLIVHRGDDGQGSNSGRFNPYRFLVKARPPDESPVKIPVRTEPDLWALILLRQSWSARVQRMTDTIGRWRRQLLAMLYRST